MLSKRILILFFRRNRKKQEETLVSSCFVFASYASFSLPWQVKRIT